MTMPSVADPPAPESFCHEALLYSGDDDFLDHALPFVRDGVAAGEAVLVVVGDAKIAALRAELADEADAVHFADMDEVGANPARIIPAWREFVHDHGTYGQRVRGIGEPISATRSPAELVECQRHESLLNVAFADSSPWWLLCPYDIDSLDADVLEEAHRSHPFVMEGTSQRPSPAYVDAAAAGVAFDGDLPEPATRPFELFFESIESLPWVRAFVDEHAAKIGLTEAQTADVVLAVHEVAANSLRHGGGEGWLRVWWDGEALICEVHDRGRIGDPLVGRLPPAKETESGRGLWIANQVCDLVQLRSTELGNVVRIHKKVVAPASDRAVATD